MLSFRDVTKKYGQVTALDSISLDVPPGEVLAIIGANGAGKTTLIKCALGLIQFDGQVTVKSIDVVRKGKEARRSVGYLPQNPALHSDMTVRETAEFYAQLRRVSAERAKALVEKVGLLDHSAKRVSALSGGMKQRLALAIAMMSDPEIIILDEPASSLDVQARIDLRQMLQEQRALGRSIVLSTHLMEDIPFLADRALVLDRGQQIFLGPASELATSGSVAGRLYLRLNGHSNEAAALIKSSFAVESVDRSGEWLVVSGPADQKTGILEALVRADVHILDVRMEEASVEGVIQRLSSAGKGNQS